jgi:hypothetical protein
VTNDGEEIEYTIYKKDDGIFKFDNPVHDDKLDPLSEESYFFLARKRLRSIYDDNPELFEDKLVYLYRIGLGAAVSGAQNAIEAEGLVCLTGNWDKDKRQYNFQAKGEIPLGTKSLSEMIDDSQPVVPLASLTPTG